MNILRVLNTINTALSALGVYQGLQVFIIGGIHEGTMKIANSPVPW